MTNCAVLVLNKQNHFVTLFLFEFNKIIWRRTVEFTMACVVNYDCLILIISLSCLIITWRWYLVCVHWFCGITYWVWLRYHVGELMTLHIFKLDFYFLKRWRLFLCFNYLNFFNISSFFALALLIFLIFDLDLSILFNI